MSRKILDEASLFVASIADLLVKRSTEESGRVVEVLRRRGVITARDFTEVVDSTPGTAFSSELLWAYSYLARRVVDLDFAEGLPAFVSVTHKALMDSAPWDERSQRRLFGVLDRILDARVASDELANRFSAALSVAERTKLEDITLHAPQDRKGYWEAVELMCAVYPDTSSLEFVFCALDRFGSRRCTKVDREGTRRCVSAAAAGNFPGAFECVAHALREGDRWEKPWLVRAVVEGLAFHADRVTGALARYLSSSDLNHRELACRVCIAAAQDDEVLLSNEEREELRNELTLLAASGAAPDVQPRSLDKVLEALALVSNVPSDIEQVRVTVRERLRRGEVVPSELVSAYAEGLARIVGEGGIVGFKPLSWKRASSLSANPPIIHNRVAGARRVVAPDAESVFENLALEIGTVQSFDRVVELCRQHGKYLDPRSLKMRDNDAISLFYELRDAAVFSQHYANLCEKGPLEFAAVMFPEFLSALERGRRSANDSVVEALGVNALRSSAALTSLLVNNPEARELATARMSPSDWSVLASLHRSVRREFPKVYPDLGLATFALRSTVESDRAWQRELLKWWHEVDDMSRNSMDPNALAFVSVAAERSKPGSALSLLSKLSLTAEDAITFRDLAVGLMVRPKASTEKILDFVSSAKGDDLARGLLLSQLMVQHLSDAQRAFIVGVARRSLDELGILSLDAVSTVGSLSRSQNDAAMLFESSPALGVSENLHRVSCARAAAQILRNLERAG
jgi:hypothetical protein